MTTAEPPDLETDLEDRLHSWMASTSTPDLSDLSASVIGSTRAARQRPRFRVPARNRRSTVARERRISRRRAAVGLATVSVLTAAVVAAVLVVPGLLRDHGPLPGRFRATGDVPLFTGQLTRSAVAVLPDGRILFVGAGETLLAGVIFDPATDTYGRLIFDRVLRRGATATTLGNDLVLLTGGEFGESGAASDTTVLFDPASETFAPTTPLAVARSEHTATLLADGRVLIAGGRHYPGSGSPEVNEFVVALDSVEIYDPATGLVTESAPMHVARAGQSATALADGRVLIAGGYTSLVSGEQSMTTTAEVFDPATGTFRLVGSMLAPRGHHAATLLNDGRVLLTGGADRYNPRGEKQEYTATAETFDPVTETFTAVSPLVTERAGHSATLLPDGRVLVIGGSNERGNPHSTEVFDPATGRFEAGPRATGDHPVALAPRLTDGRVLAMGIGAGGSEVFDPSLAARATALATPSSPPTGAFTPVLASGARGGAALFGLPDGRILLAGGESTSAGEFIPRLEIVDTVSGRVDQVSSESTQAYPVTSVPDGRVLFLSSDGDRNTASYLDPTTRAFVPAEAVTKAMENQQLVGVSGPDDGRLLLVDLDGTWTDLDPTTGATGPPILGIENWSEFVRLDDGRVLIARGMDANALIADFRTGRTEVMGLQFDHGIRLDGGRIALVTTTYDSLGGQTQRVTGVYDPATREFVPVDASLPAGAIPSVDGRRLYAFGAWSEIPSDVALEIDPATWTTRSVGPMLGARSFATALALPDGRIFIAGGARVSPDRTDPVSPEAELFDPSRIP